MQPLTMRLTQRAAIIPYKMNRVSKFDSFNFLSVKTGQNTCSTFTCFKLNKTDCTDLIFFVTMEYITSLLRISLTNTCIIYIKENTIILGTLPPHPHPGRNLDLCMHKHGMVCRKRWYAIFKSILLCTSKFDTLLLALLKEKRHIFWIIWGNQIRTGVIKSYEARRF